MIGRLKDLTIDRNGGQVLSLHINGDFSEAFDALKDEIVDVQVKKYRAKRSLDANAYSWLLLDRIAQVSGVDKMTVYRETIRNIAGVSDIVCVPDKAVERLRESWQRNGAGWQTETMPSKLTGCTNVILYYGSSSYDSAQMSRLIDALVAECKTLGIETDSSAYIEGLKEKWR